MMTALIAGLVLFLGVHSVRMFADGWRTAQIARIGEKKWKGLYALASLAGFALIVWGYGQARMNPAAIWVPPTWGRTAAILLLIPAFVLIVAGNMRGTNMKTKLGHPMLAGTALWAFAHLLANGRLAAVVLFGSFFVWTLADLGSARRRDAAAGVVYPPGKWSRDVLAIVIGVAGWVVFGMWLHGPLIGARVLG